MINAYKNHTHGVMRTRFTEKVWSMFPPDKHGWLIESDLKKDIPSEIIDYMNQVAIPDEIIEIEHNFPTEFNTEQDADKEPQDAASKRGKPRDVAKVAGDTGIKKVRGRKRR